MHMSHMGYMHMSYMDMHIHIHIHIRRAMRMVELVEFLGSYCAPPVYALDSGAQAPTEEEKSKWDTLRVPRF